MPTSPPQSSPTLPCLPPLQAATTLPDESFELTSIYLIAYSLLVPIFPVRYVAVAMVSLTALSLVVSTFVGFFIRESLVELYVNLVVREFLKVRPNRSQPLHSHSNRPRAFDPTPNRNHTAQSHRAMHRASRSTGLGS